MKLQIAKVIGLNTDQKAALSASFPGEEDNFFLGILQLECDDAFTKGRQILSEVADNFFATSAGPAQRLTEAVELLKQKLIESSALSFLLANFSGKALYLIGQGEVLAKLRREGSTSPLDISSGQVVSGFLQSGDRVLLSTQSLVNFLGDDLNRSLGLELVQWEEEITEKIRGSEIPSQAGLVLEVETPEEEVVPEYAKVPEAIPSQAANVLKNIFSLINLKRIFPKSGRVRLILAALLILVIGAGLFYQFKSKQDAERSQQFGMLFQTAREDFEAAKSLANLEPQAAKDKISSAKDSLNKALAIKSTDQGALDLKKQIEEEEAGILQQFAVPKLPEFLDLGLIKDGFQAQNLNLSDGKILLLDTNTKTLVFVNLAKKSNQVLAGKDKLGEAEAASLNGDAAFVYSLDKGILKVGLNDKKVVVVSKKDDGWGKMVDLAGFAGNVYVLDGLKNQVWKYVAGSTGYSDKREYLEKGAKVELTDTIRMQIESSIYILKQGGEILRFTKGAADHFSIGGLDRGIKDPKSIFVSSDTDNFYVLDSGNSRLVVLTKTGAYKAQYQAEEFGKATDLVVDEKGKKVYLLLGSKVYSMDLK